MGAGGVKARVAAGALALAVLLAAGPVLAQDFGGGRPEERYFRVEWEAAKDRRGRPILEGYVYNSYGLWATRVRLLIEALDAGGRVVASRVGYVNGDVPAGNRTYFVVEAPGPAASYRVRVLRYDWLDDGRFTN